MGTSVVGKSLLAALFCLTVGCACNRPAEYYAMQDRDRYAEPSEEEAQPSQEPQEPSGEPEASADASPDPVQELVSPTDMVLLYGGNKARKPYKWTTSYMKDYVLYRDREDKALKDSDVAEDNDLYHEFCEFVISRPIRETH